MIDIMFVILNYNVVTETINCVQSIKDKIDADNYKIVIVDNNSKGSVYDKLQKVYYADDRVDLIRTDENIGFARGNNYGIDYARKFNPKYICCINNDTLLVSENFYSILEKKYQKYGSAVIGPRIILKNGNEQHRNGKLLSITEYKELLHNMSQSITETNGLNQNGIITRLKKNRFVRKWYDRFLANTLNNRAKYFEETTDVILHGCWLIFTPAFFERLDGFNPDTFLYLEEELLYASLKVEGLHSLYAPDLIIKHLEDISTDTITSNNIEKRKFTQKHTVDSLRVLITYLENNKEEIYNSAE